MFGRLLGGRNRHKRSMLLNGNSLGIADIFYTQTRMEYLPYYMDP